MGPDYISPFFLIRFVAKFNWDRFILAFWKGIRLFSLSGLSRGIVKKTSINPGTLIYEMLGNIPKMILLDSLLDMRHGDFLETTLTSICMCNLNVIFTRGHAILQRKVTGHPETEKFFLVALLYLDRYSLITLFYVIC